jgi:hypothetical protein
MAAMDHVSKLATLPRGRARSRVRGKIRKWGDTHNSTEYLCHEQCLYILSREEEGGPGNNQDQTADNCVSVPKAFGHPAVEEKPNHFTNVSSLKCKFSALY